MIWIFTEPAKPSDLILQSVTQSSVEISFKAPLGAVSYQIEISPTGRVETTTKTRLTIDGLSPGEDYNVSVIAIGRFQEGVGSLRSEPSHISFITGLWNWQALFLTNSFEKWKFRNWIFF